MLRQGKDQGTSDSIYERERLRSRARKLGLRLIKSSSPQPLNGQSAEARLASQAGSNPTDPASNPELKLVDLDRCG